MSKNQTTKAGAFRGAFAALAAFAVVTAIPAIARAQTGSIAGVVTDSAGMPISGAEVVIPSGAINGTTGEKGKFHFAGVHSGLVLVRARRLGYRPDSAFVQVADNSQVDVMIRLSSVALSLDPVVVRTNKVEYKGRLAGYYERLARRSSGYFITRADIDRDNPRSLAQLLQRAPGMSQLRGRGGLSGVRMRGRNCWPLVWLDGTQMPSGEVDLDGISPTSLHGIELYLGSTTAPIRYTGSRDLSSCGTILLWSRGPDTDPITSRHAGLSNLEGLVAAMAVFTADQVDRQAEPDPSKALVVEYPAALFAEKTPGVVSAEFIVGADGRVENDTFGVVSSTDVLFSNAVRTALQDAVFIPALKGGRPVRQLVHLPFSFSPRKSARE